MRRFCDTAWSRRWRCPPSVRLLPFDSLMTWRGRESVTYMWRPEIPSTWHVDDAFTAPTRTFQSCVKPAQASPNSRLRIPRGSPDRGRPNLLDLLTAPL
jgi:hypothetical protein